jgi:hypothetical protein
MPTDYQSLRERALKSPTSQFLHVPIIPSLGMIAAAADATDVFFEGDRLWQWFDSYEQERDLEGIHVDPGLIERYGIQKAFVMACLADLWGEMLDGVEAMLTMRSRNPRSAKDLIYFLPDRCPPGGWPKDKEAFTDTHKAHARYTSEPFSTYWTTWHRLDDETEAVAPRRLPESVAQGAARAYLSVGTFMQFQDIVKLAGAPYVAGMTKEGYFMDDEVHLLVLSAMWRAAIAWLEGDLEDAVEFPFHPDCQAEILTHMVFSHRELWRKVDDFISKTPFNRFAVYAKGSMLSFTTTDGKSSFWYQESDRDKLVRSEGLRLRVGRDRSGLADLLHRMSKRNVWKVEAIGIDAPWGADG